MAIFKAVHLKVCILTDPSDSDETIEQMVQDAMYEFCVFKGVQVEVLESHDTVLADLDYDVEA